MFITFSIQLNKNFKKEPPDLDQTLIIIIKKIETWGFHLDVGLKFSDEFLQLQMGYV